MQVLAMDTTAMDLMVVAFVLNAQRGKSEEKYELSTYTPIIELDQADPIMVQLEFHQIKLESLTQIKIHLTGTSNS